MPGLGLWVQENGPDPARSLVLRYRHFEMWAFHTFSPGHFVMDVLSEFF